VNRWIDMSPETRPLLVMHWVILDLTGTMYPPVN
jgi:hypothetical protein